MNKRFLIGIVTVFFLSTIFTISASNIFEKYNPDKTNNRMATSNSGTQGTVLCVDKLNSK